MIKGKVGIVSMGIAGGEVCQSVESRGSVLFKNDVDYSGNSLCIVASAWIGDNLYTLDRKSVV